MLVRPPTTGLFPVGLYYAQAHACAGFRGRRIVFTLFTEAERVAPADTIKEAMYICDTCRVLFFRVLVPHASRLSRTMRGQGIWHKTQRVRRIRSTLTFETTF